MSSAASARDLVLTSAALPKKENILKWHLLTLQLYCLEGEIHPFVECQDRSISMLFIPLEKIYPHCTGLLKRVKFPPSRISKTRFPLQWKQGLFIRKNIFLLLFNNKQTKTPKQNKLEKKKEKRIQIKREMNFIPPLLLRSITAVQSWWTALFLHSNFQLQSYILPRVRQRNLAEIYGVDPLVCSGCFACFSNTEQL